MEREWKDAPRHDAARRKRKRVAMRTLSGSVRAEELGWIVWVGRVEGFDIEEWIVWVEGFDTEGSIAQIDIVDIEDWIERIAKVGFEDWIAQTEGFDIEEWIE